MYFYFSSHGFLNGFGWILIGIGILGLLRNDGRQMHGMRIFASQDHCEHSFLLEFESAAKRWFQIVDIQFE